MTTEQAIQVGLVAEYIENEYGIDWHDIERLYHMHHYPNAIMLYNDVTDMFHVYHVDRSSGVTNHYMYWYHYVGEGLAVC